MQEHDVLTRHEPEAISLCHRGAQHETSVVSMVAPNADARAAEGRQAKRGRAALFSRENRSGTKRSGSSAAYPSEAAVFSSEQSD